MPSRRRQGRWIAWSITAGLLVLTVALIGVVMARAPAPVPPPQKKLTGVATLVVVPRAHRESLLLPARLEADRSAGLGFELSGRLQAWLVEEGAPVAAGQEMARLDSQDLEAQRRQAQARRATADRTAAVARETVSMARVSLAQAEKNAASLGLDLDSARAAFDLATKEYARAKALARAAVAAPSELDRAENAHTLARLGVAKAEDAVERSALSVQAAQVAVRQAEAGLELNLSQVAEADRQVEVLDVAVAKTHLLAPFAGRFEEPLLDVGDVVSSGQVVGRLYDLAWLRAAVDVPDRYAPLLDPSSPLVQKYIDVAMPGARQDLAATVTIPGMPKLTGGAHAGIELQAVIHRVAQAADAASNTFRVELRLQNPGEALKEGILAQARISFLSYEQATLIPLKAVQVADVGPRVLVVETVDGHDVARVRDIEAVSIQNDEVLIRSGLRAGDRLVVSGAKGVVDGEEVRVIVADGHVQAAPAVAPAAIRVEPAASTGEASP